MTSPKDMAHGFVLSEAAIYSFLCQDVFPDILSFATAIPDHLKSLFLIPIRMETISIASRVASRVANSDDADLFGYKSLVDDFPEDSNAPPDEGGSIFTPGPHHQEEPEENIMAPSDTSYLNADPGNGIRDWPYRVDYVPHHSSKKSVPYVAIVRLALKSDDLTPRVPDKIKQNAESCTVQFISYDKAIRVYTFEVNCGNGAKTVQAKLSDVDELAMSCNCPFWRWNGPEFNAKTNSFLLGQPFGTAAPPDVRDPNRKFWLCKHAYAVQRRLDSFVQQVVEENWDLDDDDMLEAIDADWDKLEGTAQVPLATIEEEDPEVEVVEDDAEWDGPEEAPTEEESPEEEPKEPPVDEELPPAEEEDESGGETKEPPPEEPEVEEYDVDLSDLEEPEIPQDEVPPEEPEVEEYDVDLSDLEEPEKVKPGKKDEEEDEDYSADDEEDPKVKPKK